MLRVLKYGTGHEIPKGATFLSTQVEKITKALPGSADGVKQVFIENNTLVWHYFLVECDQDGNPPATRERP